MKTSLIEIKKGNTVRQKERNEKYEILDFYLTPNGMNSPELICVVIAKNLETGRTLSCTSNKFIPCDDIEYDECYPSLRMHSLEETK